MASKEIPYPPEVVHIDIVLLTAFNEETLPDSLMSHVEGLIVAKTQAEEWEQNRSLCVAKRLEEEDRAEKKRVEKEKAEASLKEKEEKKAAELQMKKAEKEAEEKKTADLIALKKEKEIALKTQAELEKKKKKALLAKQMKQTAESMKADKAKSNARKKAAEKLPEVQGGNEEVDREKTEYETRDAAREIRREIGLKARNDPAAPSDTEESQDLPQTIAEVKITAKEFGLRIKIPAGRSTSTSSSVAVSQKKKAIDTLVPDTSNVKLTSLFVEQEQAASSPIVMSEHTAQQEEGDEVLGKNQEDITRPEEPPTSSSLPRTESVDASAEEGRTCDFEAEATRDLNVNDVETDEDAPVPTPEVRMKRAVEKKSVAPSDPSEPSDPSSSSDEEEEEEKKEEEKEPTQESDDLMEIDRLPEDLLKTAPKKKRSGIVNDREDRRLSRMLVRSQAMSEDNRELLSPKPMMPISSDREKVYFKALKNAELRLVRLNNGLKYKEERSAEDRRFWSFEQQN
ncbi:calponin homology domain-containing protein DDB_G0272472-like [Brachypodium distachyon]|uniref:calponin homology domain-containing protein DDB_G0272472-like n=1 Tax=Brachypodium distachyon TaxID=15368 RepID=UPI00052FFBE5|nr:calponin homology domain-containing protein DDB_G0272472-like [Brachypodium distachyon]|eukprot:XP_010236387.1 calponin homology domain-containing protein DDB_G0272472-like [Brachypodium distachyon]